MFLLLFYILLFFSIKLFTNVIWYIIVSLQYTALFYMLNKAFQLVYLELIMFLANIIISTIKSQIAR